MQGGVIFSPHPRISGGRLIALGEIVCESSLPAGLEARPAGMPKREDSRLTLTLRLTTGESLIPGVI